MLNRVTNAYLSKLSSYKENTYRVSTLTIFDTLPKKRVKVKKMDMIKESAVGGDCYKANGDYFMDNAYHEPNLRLVHGEVRGQGELQGITYGHCWCELNGDVLDFSNGRNIKIDKRVYYALGGIDHIDNLHVYDLNTFNKNIEKHGHWGPWDLKTKSGL
jgi:hypothetical protein